MLSVQESVRTRVLLCVRGTGTSIIASTCYMSVKPKVRQQHGIQLDQGSATRGSGGACGSLAPRQWLPEALGGEKIYILFSFKGNTFYFGDRGDTVTLK